MEKKRKNKPETVLRASACVLILLGICVLAYPYGRDMLIEAGQQRLMAQWLRSLTEETADEQAESGGGGKPSAPAAEPDGAANVSAPPLQRESAGNRSEADAVIGILKIEAIALEQPILRGATARNLSKSVCTIEPGDAPGEIGNFVIAGHNSRAFGRNFNRLCELQPEDEITVILSDRTLRYRVDSVTVIASDAVDILSGDGSTALITLLTCHYRTDGTVDRLAVCGELIP